MSALPLCSSERQSKGVWWENLPGGIVEGLYRCVVGDLPRGRLLKVCIGMWWGKSIWRGIVEGLHRGVVGEICLEGDS